MLANRLRDHVLGKVNMSATQVQAATVLLRKTLPDLTATELSGEVAHPSVIRAPDQPATSKAWLDQHGPVQQQDDAAHVLPSNGESKLSN